MSEQPKRPDLDKVYFEMLIEDLRLDLESERIERWMRSAYNRLTVLEAAAQAVVNARYGTMAQAKAIDALSEVLGEGNVEVIDRT